MVESNLIDKLDGEHHIEITAYVVDGPNSWTRPESTPDREVIGGIRTADASKWKYREIIHVYTQLLEQQLIKAMEEAGVLE